MPWPPSPWPIARRRPAQVVDCVRPVRGATASTSLTIGSPPLTRQSGPRPARICKAASASRRPTSSAGPSDVRADSVATVIAQPSASVAAASTATRIVADHQVRDRAARIGSVAGCSRACQRVEHALGDAGLRGPRSARESPGPRRGVDRSSTVGPEAIRSSGSPSTSEMISAMSRPARHARASPPPLIRLSCLRTVFSSSIGARPRSEIA